MLQLVGLIPNRIIAHESETILTIIPDLSQRTILNMESLIRDQQIIFVLSGREKTTSIAKLNIFCVNRLFSILFREIKYNWLN